VSNRRLEVVRDFSGVDPSTTGSPVCAVVHVYYPELFDEIVERLQRCATLHTVIVTYTTDDHYLRVQQSARPLVAQGATVELVRVDNRGRDMLPFVTVAPRALATGCQAFVKVHTKRSPHLGPYGDRWRRGLLDGLLPDPATIAQASQWFSEVDNVGFGVPYAYLGTWAHRGSNRRNVRRLAQRAGLRAGWRSPFPAGGMYWSGAEWLELVVALGLGADDFEAESGQLDGTTAHALERLVGCFAMSRRARVWIPGPPPQRGTALLV